MESKPAYAGTKTHAQRAGGGGQPGGFGSPACGGGTRLLLVHLFLIRIYYCMLRAVRTLLVGLVLIGMGVIAGQVLQRGSLWGAPPEAYGMLEEAVRTVEAGYVDSVSRQQLGSEALRSMLRELDPHSTYIDAERMQRVRESFDASFEGIGVTYERIRAGTAPDTAVVVSVIPGGPSDEAGLHPGDRLLRTDSTALVGQPDRRIQALLKGPGGTTVNVTVRRPGVDTPISIAITRGRIPLHTVDAAYMLDATTGYVKLNRFARTTHSEMRTALTQLKNDGMRRLVLDLRNNAGGLMQVAERVADEFLHDGELVVEARGRDDEVVDSYRTQHVGHFEEGPMMVLVNGLSASASEIVAGALHDHDRALVVGQRTYGKGLVQRQYQLDDGSGLRLTIARFYTPSGRIIQRPYETGTAVVRPVAYTDSTRSERAGGIVPDRTVPSDSVYQQVQRLIQQPAVRAELRAWVDQNIRSLREAWGGRPESFLETYRIPGDATTRVANRLRAAGRAPLPLAERPPVSASERATVPHEDLPGYTDPEDAIQAYIQLANTERGTILLQNALTSMVARRLFGMAEWVRVRNRVDPTVQATDRLWRHATTRARTYATRH